MYILHDRYYRIRHHSPGSLTHQPSFTAGQFSFASISKWNAPFLFSKLQASKTLLQETSGVSSLSSFISSVRGSSEDSRNGRAWLTHCNTAQHDNTISRKSQHCRLSIFLYLTQRVPFHHFRQFGLRVSPLSSSNSFGLCTVKDSVVIP
jgi:hypothetical protein